MKILLGVECQSHSVHQGITPPHTHTHTHTQKAIPYFLPSLTPPPPLNLQTVQAPLPFRQSPPLHWFFMNPPLKVGLFSEPKKY